MNGDKEVYRIIEGYGGVYSVSSQGSIYSNFGRGRILKPGKGSSGYLQVVLCVGGGRKNHSIHRLVALAFVRGYKPNLLINHKDEDKMNNHYTNLE